MNNSAPPCRLGGMSHICSKSNFTNTWQGSLIRGSKMDARLRSQRHSISFASSAGLWARSMTKRRFQHPLLPRLNTPTYLVISVFLDQRTSLVRRRPISINPSPRSQASKTNGLVNHRDSLNTIMPM